MTLRLPLAALATLGALAGASPAVAADPVITGTPKLYAAKPTGLGRPVAYVTFTTKLRLHDTGRVVPRVAGHNGRTYANRAAGTRCYRGSFINEKADGKPIRLLTAGRRYRVEFRNHGRVLRTITLTARALSADASPPTGC